MLHDPLPCSVRMGRLRSEFADADALLVLSESNIRYLTGFTGTGILMAGRDWLTLLVDGRYATQARAEAPEAEILEFRNRVEGVAAMVRQRGVGSVAFESSCLSVEESLRLREALPGTEWNPVPKSFECLRALKDDGEIHRIREAARIAHEALASVQGMIRPGVRESEIAMELEYRMRRAGAEKVSFETIVASGPRSALPHATPGNRVIADGDCVMIDYGAVWEGYHSDETCTFLVGRSTERQREVYRHVLEAHDRAIQAVRAGVSCGEIDGVARSYLDGEGLGSGFAHATGHGVGLEVHEAPRLAAGREERLQSGMVVTVEPGVYLPGLWGIRIEDTILVTEEGCEILTRTSKKLTQTS